MSKLLCCPLSFKPWLKIADTSQGSAAITCKTLPTPTLDAVVWMQRSTLPHCRLAKLQTLSDMNPSHGESVRNIPGLLPRTNTRSSLGMTEWRVVCKVLPPSAAHLLLPIFSRGKHQDTHFIGKETEAQRQESVPNPITTRWLRGGIGADTDLYLSPPGPTPSFGPEPHAAA